MPAPLQLREGRALHFAPLVHRDRLDQFHDPRHFVEREAGAAELAHLLTGDVGARDDGGGDDLAARSGRFTIDLHLANTAELKNDLLHLARVHLLSRCVDEITGAADDCNLAITASLDQIVGRKAARLEWLEMRLAGEVSEGCRGALHGDAAL